MKKQIIILLLMSSAFITSTLAQSQEIDPDIAKLCQKVKCTHDFIDFMNNYFKIDKMAEIDKKEFNEYADICKCINKKNIPIYKIQNHPKEITFYFKKGGDVISFNLVKNDDKYYSKFTLYTFKNKRIKKQGTMVFTA